MADFLKIELTFNLVMMMPGYQVSEKQDNQEREKLILDIIEYNIKLFIIKKCAIFENWFHPGTMTGISRN